MVSLFMITKYNTFCWNNSSITQYFVICIA